jgi:integrase
MKTPKGTVAIENSNNRLRLRWSCEGQRYCLALGLPNTPINLKLAKKTASQIELDIASGNFDVSLDKYRHKQTSKRKVTASPNKDYLLSVWDKWVSTLRLSSRTLNGHYKAIRRHIERANPPLIDSFWFESIESLSPGVFNNYLGYLKKCLDWAVSEELSPINPYKRVKRRKVVKNTVKPFTTEEITKILNAFRNNQFCPKSSAYKHSHYVDFVEFLFLSGVRISEAIGLQVKHVDFERNEVVICSVLARGDKGHTNAAKRVRKETKTGSIRYLSMTPRLREMLATRSQGLKPDDLIFTSPNGNPIDDRMFLRRQWKPVLEGLGIEYRRLYIARHTLASMAIEQGIPLTSVAYLLGHADTSMVSRVYGHMINRPSLPEIKV